MPRPAAPALSPCRPSGSDPTPALRLRRGLARDPSSPRRARRLLAEVLVQAGADDLLDDACLLTSELVTNAIEHAHTSLELRIVLDGHQLSVCVHDHGSRRAPLVARRPETLATSGRGLFLVEEIAASWGSSSGSDGHAVWFTLDRP